LDVWDGVAKDGMPESGDCTKDNGRAPRRERRRDARVAIADKTARRRSSGTADTSGCGSYHASSHPQGTDSLPYIGNKARLLYRDIGGFDTRGVIRLTCGSN
jgi:hypothetical protein